MMTFSVKTYNILSQSRESTDVNFVKFAFRTENILSAGSISDTAKV